MQQRILITILNMILLCILACAETTTASTITVPEINFTEDTECGTNVVPSVGHTSTETSVKNYPWVASIYFKDPSVNEQAKLYGTASIITVKHLLTVASVVPSNDTNSFVTSPENFFAVVGGQFGGEGILYEIEYIYKYFRSGHPILGAGLAIAQVENKIIFTNYVRPICLPEIDFPDIQQQKHSLTVLGWHSDNSSEKPVLHEFDVQLQPEDYCQQFIQGHYPADELVCGICSGSDETTSKCNVGNGGPLILSIYGQVTIFGVTDSDIGHVLPNENTDIPIYFLKIDSYSHMDWITTVIDIE